MEIFEFDVREPLAYHYTGKFKAPSPEWKHNVIPLNEYELFVITEGCLYIADNNGRYTVKKGEHLLLTPTQNNMRTGFQPSDCSFYWLHFRAPHGIIKRENDKDFQHDPQKIYIPLQGILPAAEKVIILMKQLQDSIRSNYEPNFINYTTTIILCEIYNQFFPKKTAYISDSNRQIYNDIIDYIRLTIYRNIKVSDIAEHFGYNEKYLSHLFSTIEGLPLKQYILKEKMDQAKYMLTDTNDTINQIAASLSFTDNHNFMKAFKKIAGFTPTEYRNAYSKRLLYDK
ncbi:AraC family transcriptional regulator [Clostridium sp. KNHs205]|uniref:helix-turn-helix domain-containing protein n=1 Tax=Clostridium sp. KNHs205 TaxID=1449050 RepID=UPI00051BF4DC|nr:AraC family transcriptional regulator [Clostridium sp. KNHs205]